MHKTGAMFNIDLYEYEKCQRDTHIYAIIGAYAFGMRRQYMNALCRRMDSADAPGQDVAAKSRRFPDKDGHPLLTTWKKGFRPLPGMARLRGNDRQDHWRLFALTSQMMPSHFSTTRDQSLRADGLAFLCASGLCGYSILRSQFHSPWRSLMDTLSGTGSCRRAKRAYPAFSSSDHFSLRSMPQLGKVQTRPP